MSFVKSLMGSPKVWSSDLEIIPAIISFDNDCRNRLGTPVIVSREEFEKGYETEYYLGTGVHGILYFPQGNGHNPRNSIGLPAENLRPIDPKKLIYGRRVLEVETFDFDCIDNIVDLVEAEAAVTFVLKNHEEMLRFLGTCHKSFQKKFKYTSSICHYRTNEYNQGKTGILLQVSFYSLPYAVPSFFRSRGKGMAVNFGVMYDTGEEHSQPKVIKEQFSLMSTDENIHVVDGQRIRGSGFISSETLDYMKAVVAKDKTYRETTPVEKQEEASEKSEKILKKPTRATAKPSKTSNDYTYYTFNTSTSTSTW